MLIDKLCSAKAAQQGGQAAAGHSRDCALMSDCAGSGYGVLTAEGKFIALDAEGNKKAAKALHSSKKTKNLRVRVSGEQSGDTFQVKSLRIL